MLISNNAQNTCSPLKQMTFSNNAAKLDSAADSDTTDEGNEADTKMSRAEYLKSLPPCMSLYFLQLTSLAIIAKRMTVKLYSPEALQAPWASTNFIIQSLMLDIDSWFMNLPPSYDFTSTQTSQCPLGQRMGLAFLFYSTKIGITRPCLCRLDTSQSDGDLTYEFCSKTAAECVESACHMLNLFPDSPDAALLHRISPWWCTLHYLMQSITVLLLELAFQAEHVPEKAAMVSKAAKKALHWLHTLSRTNAACERAWKLCDGFLRRLAPQFGISISELSENEDSSTTSLIDVPELDESTLATENPVMDQLSFDPSTSIPSTNAIESIAADMDSIAWSPMDHSGAPLAMSPSLKIEEPDLMDAFMSPEKSQSGRSSFDDYYPYDPATGQITGSFFPTGPNLDLDMGYFWGDPVC